MRRIAEIYRRALLLVRDWPWLIAIPVCAEMIQHGAELRLGMYRGGMSAGGNGVRLAFGVLKVLMILIVLIGALRLWRFGGDAGRAFRPTLRAAKGLGVVIAVQVIADIVAVGIGHLLFDLAGHPAPPTGIIFKLAPVGLWLLLSVTLFPWYVALVTEDDTMTFSRSVRGAMGQWPVIGGLFLAAALPLMIAHYGLSYAAFDSRFAWPLMIVDAAVVGCLTAALASGYYGVYQRVAARTASA